MQLQHWGIWSFLEVAGGLGKGVGFQILAEGTVPQGSSGTKSLNNSLNVNNLKIFLLNCFPSSASLCRRVCTGKLVFNHHCTEHDCGGVGWAGFIGLWG